MFEAFISRTGTLRWMELGLVHSRLGMEGNPTKSHKAATSQFHNPCEIWDGVQKISHGLQNFHTPCEIFAAFAKFSQPSCEISRFNFGRP